MDNPLVIIPPVPFVVNIVSEFDKAAEFHLNVVFNSFGVNTVVNSGLGAIGEEFTMAEKVKLAAIEALAKDDQTGSEIKVLYEGEDDTNAFTDAEKASLGTMEDGATADQTGGEIKTLYEQQNDTNAFNDAALSKLAAIEASATADQSGSEIKTLYELEANTNAYTDAEKTKLTGIETAATADQSDTEIKAAYENNADTNVFTDLEKAKLGDIEDDATADQSGGEIKTLYENEGNTNAFTDSEKAKLGAIDATHYGAPLQSTTALTALLEADNTDKERRYVEDEISDYFYDVQASSGDLAPDDQTGGTGWWKKVVASGETAASVKTKYESNPDTNVHTDAQVSKLAAIEAGATADQSNSEIRTAVANATNSNVYTDDDETKLGLIEASATADQSDGEIEAAYNAQVAKISAGEITAGTEAAVRRVSPADLKAIVLAHETGGSGGMSDAEVETAYNNRVAQISAGEIAAGTEGTVRRVAPDDLVAVIIAHAPAAIDSAHYADPVADIAALTALPEATLVDRERRFVDAEIADYFYDIAAATGDEAPDDQQDGTGFWMTVADEGGGGGGSNSPAQIKSKYEKNSDTNAFDDAALSKLAAIEAGATTDQSDGEIASAYANQVAQVSGAEITAGTESALRTYSPADIKAIVLAHESGGGSSTAVNEQTDDYTLVLTDANDIIEMNKATANQLLIPLNSVVNFPIGTVISASQMGVGVTTIKADTGVTLNGVSGGAGAMTDKFDGTSFYQRATDVWVAQGAIGTVA